MSENEKKLDYRDNADEHSACLECGLYRLSHDWLEDSTGHKAITSSGICLDGSYHTRRNEVQLSTLNTG